MRKCNFFQILETKTTKQLSVKQLSIPRLIFHHLAIV